MVTVGAGLGPACGTDDGGPDQEPEAVAFPQSVASGDPRPEGVVLWTRALDPEKPERDVALELEVFLDPDLSERVPLEGARSRRVTSQAAHDHCVKVRLTGLLPDTVYYYRFVAAGGGSESRVGRTQTAPAEDADRSIRFSVVSCQDFEGKFYHVYRHLLDADPDFVLHLGDYVYETASSEAGERRVVFSEPESALDLGDGRLAARSLDNYRDLYRTYRSDPDLQAVHERYPMIVISDDHEFSDDCHGATATYTDGQKDETDLERRLASDQAWFEHMPVDFDEEPAQPFDPDRKFPEDMTLYRRFVFGQHLELWVTDLRRYRPDHLVPEDAFPGSVFLTEQEIDELDPGLLDEAVPYVDVDVLDDGAYARALRDHADELEIDPARVTGLLSVPFINQVLESLDAGDLPAPIDAEDAELERGFAFHQLLKTAQYSRIGSRYLLSEIPFRALSRAGFLSTEGRSQRMLGQEQRDWLEAGLSASTRTFKIWGSSLCFMSRRIDLRDTPSAPPELKHRIVISGDDWDGFPDERAELLGVLANAENVLILSGDLHGFLAGTPFDPADPERRVVELVTGSVSSSTWRDAIATLTEVESLPSEARVLVAAVGDLLKDPVGRPNPHLAFQELGKNGYTLVEVGPEATELRLFMISPEDVASPRDSLDGPLSDHFTSEHFRVPAGSPDLYREVQGLWFRWDLESLSFVA